jgi:hypothetical protein
MECGVGEAVWAAERIIWALNEPMLVAGAR